MPPKWALGYMQSHRTLAGPEEVLQVAREFRERKLPCDALIYLGTGYCPAGWNTGHASVDFNPATFDKPAEMINELHDLNFQDRAPSECAAAKLTGSKVDARRRRHDRESRRKRHRRSTSPTTGRGIAKRLRSASMAGGPTMVTSSTASRALRATGCTTKGPLLDRPNVRPWNLQRTGYAGVQRYGGWIWSGDIDSRWKTLAAHVAVGQNHSLSLSPYWGTDVGGFYPASELTGELYVRWFQFGAFCPSFRATAGRGTCGCRGVGTRANLARWNMLRIPIRTNCTTPHVEPICRKYLELRYRLLPYNYTLCREAHDIGPAVDSALWLHYPRRSACRHAKDEYLWGRDVLVVPVVDPGATERTRLPARGAVVRLLDERAPRRRQRIRPPGRLGDVAALSCGPGRSCPWTPCANTPASQNDEPTTVRIYTGLTASSAGTTTTAPVSTT